MRERVLKAFDEARARGEGAVAFGGQLLDLPIVDRARQTLELAESLSNSFFSEDFRLSAKLHRTAAR